MGGDPNWGTGCWGSRPLPESFFFKAVGHDPIGSMGRWGGDPRRNLFFWGMADWWVANPTGNGFWGSRPPPESVADWGVTTPMASTGRGVATPTGIGALLSFFLEGVVDWGGHDPDGYRFRCCCCCCCCRCRQGRRWRWASGPSSRRGRPRRAAATPATSPGRRGTCACGCGRATFSSRRRRRRRSVNTHTHTQTKEQRHTVARDQASQGGCTGVSPRVEGEKGLLVAPNPKPLDDQIAIKKKILVF